MFGDPVNGNAYFPDWMLERMVISSTKGSVCSDPDSQ